MAGRSPRCEIILPVVFHPAVPFAERARAVCDLGTWVNVLVGVIPFVADTLELATLSVASHTLEVGVTCALEALFAAPVDDA